MFVWRLVAETVFLAIVPASTAFAGLTILTSIMHWRVGGNRLHGNGRVLIRLEDIAIFTGKTSCFELFKKFKKRGI